MLRALFVASFVVGACLWARPAAAGSLTLMWDFNTEPEVTGYTVYVGTRSRSYSLVLDVGNTNVFVLDSAVTGQRYYFAVRAYAGTLVSDLSVEVSGVVGSNGAVVPDVLSLRRVAPDASYTGTAAIARQSLPSSDEQRVQVRSSTGTAALVRGSGDSPLAEDGVTRVHASASGAPRTGAPSSGPAGGAVHTGTAAIRRSVVPTAAPGNIPADAGASTATARQSAGSATPGVSQAVDRSSVRALDTASPPQTAGTLRLSSTGPAVSIQTPVNQASVATGSDVILSALVQSAGGGDTADSIVWSSSLDGHLGVGGTLVTRLSAGIHVITATTSRGGAQRSARVTVVVG